MLHAIPTQTASRVVRVCAVCERESEHDFNRVPSAYYARVIQAHRISQLLFRGQRPMASDSEPVKRIDGGDVEAAGGEGDARSQPMYYQALILAITSLAWLLTSSVGEDGAPAFSRMEGHACLDHVHVQAAILVNKTLMVDVGFKARFSSFCLRVAHYHLVLLTVPDEHRLSRLVHHDAAVLRGDSNNYPA